MNALRGCTGQLLGFFVVTLVACGGGNGGPSSVLLSIEVTPANPTVRFGATQQLAATGHYSNGGTEDLTTSVVWTASTDVVTVDSAGRATGVEIGNGTVTARLGQISGSTAVSVIGVVSLPQTGQTTCYDNSVSPQSADCTDTGVPAGQDGAKRMGAPLPVPRFVVDDCGTSTDTSDDVITDSLTGLSWVRDANLAAGGGPAADGRRTWQEALNFANSLSLCGFTDWRLPNAKELRSLTDYGAADAADALNMSGFVNAQASSYWSSTTYSGRLTDAWNVDMEDGITSGNTIAKTLTRFVWPVRAGPGPDSTAADSVAIPATGQVSCSNEGGTVIDCNDTGQDGELRAGVAWPDPRFVVGSGAKDACMIDRLTGLMWVRTPDNLARSWEDALAYSETLALCGFDDWRLPNVNELESLVHLGVSSQSSALHAAGFISVPSGTYWTSTSYANDPVQAFRINMNDGAVLRTDKMNTNLVWPVR